MAIKKDTLQIELTTTGDGKVKASLAGVSRELGSVDKSGQGALRTLGNMRGLLGTLAVGAMLAFTRSTINSVAELDAWAQKLTLSTDALQVYRYAADQTNVSQGSLDIGLQRIIRRAGDAARGIGESAKVFDELGVAVTDSSGSMRDAEAIVDDVARAIARMDDKGAQLSATVQLADSEGADLVRTFRALNGGARDFAAEARALGIIIDADLIKQAAEADGKLDALEKTLSAQLSATLVELAPLITEVGNAFLEGAKGVRQFLNAGKDIADLKLASDIEAQIGRLEASLGGVRQRLQRALALKNTQTSGGSLYDEASGSELLGLALGNLDPEKLEAQVRETEQRIGKLRQRLQDLRDNPAPGSTGGGLGTPGAAAAAEAEAKASAARQKAIDSLVASLRVEADTYGVSAGQLVQYQLAKLGADDATRQLAAGLSEELAAAEAIAKAEEENAKLFEQSAEATARQVAELKQYADALTRAHNPAQQTADDLAQIEQAFDAGLISADTYFDAIDGAFDKMNKDAEDSADKVNDAWKDLGLTFSSAFEDAIVQGGNLSDVLKGLEQDILRIVTRELVTKPLGNFVADAASSFLPSLFGAATGADFIVPGTGGLDTRMLPVSSGERVTVTPPGQTGPGGGGNIYQTFNITTPNADSFRQTQRQILQDGRRAMAGA